MALSRIKTNSIADSAITGAKISDGAVVASDIAALSVDSTKLASNAVTNAKLSTNAVSIDKVDSTVTQAFGMRNRIINGDMRFDQRNVGTSKVFDASSIYHLDQWRLRYNGGAGLATATVQQSTNAPAGFKNSFLLTVGTAKTPVTGNRFGLEQPIEGYNIADLGWGTADAKTVTVSFWVKSSLTGSFGVVLGNLNDRAYGALYTINAVNTWEYKTVTVPGCTDGTWVSGNTAGIYLFFDLGQGSDVRTTPGSWNIGSILGVTGGVNVVATAGATWQLTGVQLEKGTQATTFDYRSYGTELLLCQRYYQASGGDSTPVNGENYASGKWILCSGSVITDASAYTNWVAFPTTMRASPTITYINNNLSATSGQWAYYSRNGGWSATTAITTNTTTKNGFETNVAVSLAGRDSFVIQGGYSATAEL